MLYIPEPEPPDPLPYVLNELPEEQSDYRENVEDTLIKFLGDEMGIQHRIDFHRVHRINIQDRTNDYPKPIVAKFVNFKDREYVRMQAPKTLVGKPFGVREQFPKAVEKKRKLLYPEMRKAKQNKQNKVRLVKDKLYINDIEFIPEETENESETEQTQDTIPKTRYQSRDSQNRGYPSNRSAHVPRGYSRGRTFTRSRPNRGRFNHQWAPRQTHLGRTVNFESPNMYMHLPRDDDSESMSGRSESRKNKASSPLDHDKTSKRYRDNVPENTDDNDHFESVEMRVFHSSESQNESETQMDEANSLPTGNDLPNDPSEPANKDSDVTDNQRGDQL